MNALFFENKLDDYYVGFQFAEIFKQRIYKPYIELQKNDTVIDVGGNLGLFSIYAQPYAKKIYCIEPSKQHFNCISKTTKHNKYTNIIPVKLAISHENTTTKFYHNDNVTMFSLSESVSPNKDDFEDVECVTLEKFINDNAIKQVDFLKLDIEGAEGKVLCGDGFSNVASKVKQMVVEFHSWNGYNPNQILNHLKDLGFINQRIPNEATLYYFRR